MKKVSNLSKKSFITEQQARNIANKAVHMKNVRIDAQQVVKRIPSNLNSLEFGLPITKAT
jgi:predicted transcriptional regulator